MTFGVTSHAADIVSNEPRGEGERTLTIVASGISHRAAERSARLEAQPLIPLRDQVVEFIEKERSLGPFKNRYLFRITHNADY